MTRSTVPFAASWQFEGRNGLFYDVIRLSEQGAREHSDQILAIHNTIPHLYWDINELLADGARDGTPYIGRWDVSLIVLCRGEVVGFLLAYFREESSAHPCRCAYIHRLAVRSDHQRQGVATSVVAFYVEELFLRVPWLLTVSAQTNDEPSNENVLRFYERLGFRRVQRVHYADKTDWLFELSRDDHRWQGRAAPGYEKVSLPSSSQWPAPAHYPNPFFPGGDFSGAPQLYFRTGSKEKRDQYRYLLRCFGIELVVPRHTIALAEPQVEGVGDEPEREVVTGPLKLLSRFAAKFETYPVAVEDTMLFVETFNRDFDARALLPGPDTKRWWTALGDEGLLRIMRGSRSRRARYVCQIGVHASRGTYLTYRAEVSGRIALNRAVSDEALAYFPYTNATFFHSVFIPEGAERSLGEMAAEEFARHDYRRQCVRSMVISGGSIFSSSVSVQRLF